MKWKTVVFALAGAALTSAVPARAETIALSRSPTHASGFVQSLNYAGSASRESRIQPTIFHNRGILDVFRDHRGSARDFVRFSHGRPWLGWLFNRHHHGDGPGSTPGDTPGVGDPGQGGGVLDHPGTPGDPAPEPATLMLMASGALGLTHAIRRRRQQSVA